jgi:hypothetical protein
METAAEARTLVAVQEVLLELQKKDDDVYQWAKQHLTFTPLEPAIQRAATEIVNRFPGFINVQRTRSVADPFVIAFARVNSLTVVTAERPSGSTRRPRIPDVCSGLSIRCVSLLQLFRDLGWTF